MTPFAHEIDDQRPAEAAFDRYITTSVIVRAISASPSPRPVVRFLMTRRRQCHDVQPPPSKPRTVLVRHTQQANTGASQTEAMRVSPHLLFSRRKCR